MMAKSDNAQEINLSLDPDKTPIVFADTTVVSNSGKVIVFNFAQPIGFDANKRVVARVSMGLEQAKEFIATVNDHIERNEL